MESLAVGNANLWMPRAVERTKALVEEPKLWRTELSDTRTEENPGTKKRPAEICRRGVLWI